MGAEQRRHTRSRGVNLSGMVRGAGENSEEASQAAVGGGGPSAPRCVGLCLYSSERSHGGF